MKSKELILIILSKIKFNAIAFQSTTIKEKSKIMTTPQLQQAIATIQTLSSQEQRQLLQILSETVNKSDNLEQQNQLFWQETSLEDLIKTQKTPVVEDPKNLAGDYWEKDSTEDFLSFLKEQRQSKNSVS